MKLQWVSPGQLRLPPSRKGVDAFKLLKQYRAFGISVVDMPPILVTRGARGVMMINDGVTRATRAHRYASGALVPVEVQEERPKLVLSKLPRISDQR